MSIILKNYLAKKHFSLKAQGNSMLPLLLSDDVIFYKKVDFKEIKTNDLVLVLKNKKYFTHRVIYKNKNYFITKGDNNLTSDGKIIPSQFVGRVIKIKRNNLIFNPERLYLLQSTLYFQEIINIKRVLEKEKINFVFLKGLPLHLYFEKNHPRRIYFDCDVLISKKQFLRAEKILLHFGYTKNDSSLSKSQKKLSNKEVEIAYYKIINGFLVTFDLHFEPAFMMTQLGMLEALYQQKLISKLTDIFLETKQFVIINKKYFPILSDTNLIIYLALHFFHHNFCGSFRLELLDKVIKKTKNKAVVFKDISQIVKDYQLQNFVYPSFVLLKKYYQTPIPRSFFEDIKPNNSYSLGLGSRIYHLGSVFDDEPRIKAGISRFKNLFYLSPHPMLKKSLVFVNPQVFYTIMLLLINGVLSKIKKL